MYITIEEKNNSEKIKLHRNFTFNKLFSVHVLNFHTYGITNEGIALQLLFGLQFYGRLLQVLFSSIITL